MPVNYIDKVNQRGVGNEVLISSEAHQVGITSLNTVNLDFIRLIEVPLQKSPSTVTIPGFSEVTTTPGTNEFKVDYENGRILFDPSKNGDFVFVNYEGRGSIVDAEDINELQNPVGVALNLDGELTAGHVKPLSISTNPADNFTFPNDLTVAGDLSIVGRFITLKLPLVAGDPVSPSQGEIWFDTVTNQAKLFNGTDVVLLG